jgi:hypothetical protein
MISIRTGIDDRQYWLNVMMKITEPVFTNLAQQRLKETMSVECVTGSVVERRQFTYLEAFGRSLAGIAPWLENETQSPKENALRIKMAELARQCLDSATNSQSRDFMNFNVGRQPVVDAAFLSHAILRAPNELRRKLDRRVQENIITALKSTRVIRPNINNWLLFCAMNEAALCAMGADWDHLRVDYAVRQHEQWYKGDGAYGDGADFHWDYYNSFVIQPMLIDILKTVIPFAPQYKEMYERVMIRARRYAAIQERMISPEGAFPPIGRSLAYRFGVFQLLGQVALVHQLSDGIKPAQIRCAMTAVIKRMVQAPGTFDENGWLTIGFCGHQPSIGEEYISTGSAYLCTVGLLPLGLPPDDEFWSAPPADWTSKKAWSGQDLPADHAIEV